MKIPCRYRYIGV